MSDIKYIVRKENGEIIGCDSCASEVATHPFDWGAPYGEKHETDKRHLCEFCASSYVGNITRHHARDTEGYVRKELAVLLAQAVNYLEGKLGKAR